MAVANRPRANKWDGRSNAPKQESKLELVRNKLQKNKPKRPEKQKNNAVSSGLGRMFLRVFGWTLGLFTGVLVFLGVGKGLLLAYEYCTTSEYFAIKTIEIRGENRLKSREVLEIVGIAEGMNTLALSIVDMEKALSRNPWVDELSIRRVLPDKINIEIRERVPKYWVKRGKDLYYADELGATIAPVTPGPYGSLPILEVEKGAEALLDELPALTKSLAEAELAIDTEALAWLRLRSSGSLELKVNDSLALVIGVDNWQGNLGHLNAVVKDLSRRGELKTVGKINAQGNNVWVSRSARAGQNGGRNG